MSSRLKLFVPLGLFTLLAVLLFRGLSLDPQALPSALIDKALPEFSLPSLIDGAVINDTDLHDGPLLLNVWATWCIACRVEHPYLQELAKTGVPIYGVNYKDDEVEARTWLDELGDPYRISVVDKQGRLGLDLGVYGAPETYFIDSKGVIRYRHVGVIDERLWTSRLEPIYQSLLSERDG